MFSGPVSESARSPRETGPRKHAKLAESRWDTHGPVQGIPGARNGRPGGSHALYGVDVCRVHASGRGTGQLYQGRFKSFPAQADQQVAVAAELP
jgi:hypothetical protein